MLQDGKENEIEVIGYSGYKANERPLRFVLNRQELEVKKVLDRWAGQDHDYFKILAEDKRIYLIKWQRFLDIWFLVRTFEQDGRR